jgi:hypothetical protein
MPMKTTTDTTHSEIINIAPPADFTNNAIQQKQYSWKSI